MSTSVGTSKASGPGGGGVVVEPRMLQRFVGGESAGRSLFGGRRNRSRNVGLTVVGVAFVVLTILFQLPGLVVSAVAAAAVYAATTNTHVGTPWQRRQARRRWRERETRGTVSFAPVHRRPASLESALARGSRRERMAALVEWNAYRDWPDGVQGMQWLTWAPGHPGVAWHLPTGEADYLSVVFPVEGQIRGLEGDQVVNGGAVAFGSMLASLGSLGSRVSRVQLLTRALPVDSANHEAWVVRNLDPAASAVLVESYEQVVNQVGRGGLMQRHYVVVRWPLSGEFTRAAARLGPGQAGWVTLMEREVPAVRRRLAAARLGPGPALSAARCAAVLRHLQMPSWPIDQAGDVDVHDPWLASRDEWAFTRTRDVGPVGVVEEWLHRTAVVPIDAVETGPRTPLWLLPLLAQMPHQVVRTVSVQLETVPASQARADARADVTSDLADLEAQTRKGVLAGEELKVGIRAARSRLSDLEPGSGHHGAGWVLHVSISARTRDELAAASEQIAEAAGHCGITDLSWYDGESAAAQACTWPVARGMRPVKASTATRVRGLLAGRGHREDLI